MIEEIGNINSIFQFKKVLLANTLEDARWYVTLTILTTNIQEGIHTNAMSKYCNIATPLMPTHACMQEIRLIAIKYLTVFRLNKKRLENHQLPLPT